MKALLVNPSFPDSYWSGRNSLRFARRKSLLPPLGLITVAALLPQDWELRLVDMDADTLSDQDLRWADIVMLTGMLVQRDSLHAVLARCKNLGVTTAVGGPYATALPDELDSADHIVVGEGENTIPQFAIDLEKGAARHRYDEPPTKPDLTLAPTPRYDLLNPRHYHQMSLQFSRGCPFTCEFCDIIVMYGRKPRVKTVDQVIRELQAILATGFKGTVFWVDDNFIGNKNAAKLALPRIARWRRAYGMSLEFYTEASMNLADDLELVKLMTSAGFTAVFIGIETPSKEGLEEAKKYQNTRGDLQTQVHDLLAHGLDVWAGFILGFDSDQPDIFDRMINFIRNTVPYAMVGMLGALPNTPLYHRLLEEGRLKERHTGDQFGLTNFKTRLSSAQMIHGYHHVIASLYSADGFFARCRENLMRWKPVPGSGRTCTWHDLMSGVRALWGQGVKSDYRREYWRFLSWVLFRHPSKLKRALTQAAAGHHFILYTRDVVIPRLLQQAARIDATV